MPNFHRLMALGLVAVAWLAAVPLHAQITQAVDDVVVLKSQDMTGNDNSGTYYDPKPIIDTDPVLARSHSVYLFVHGGLWYPATPPGAYPGYACGDGDQIELFVSDPALITTPIMNQPLNSNTVMRTTPCSTDPVADNRDSKGQKLAFANLPGQGGTGTSWTHSNGVKLQGKKLMLFERSSNSGILQIPYEHRLYLFVSTTWRNPNGRWNVGKYQAVKVPASLHQTGLKLGNSAMTPIPIRTWTNTATGDKSHTFGVFFRMNRPGGAGALNTGYLELEYSPDLYGTVDPIRVSVLDQNGNMTALPADGTLNFVPGDVFEELNVNPPSHIPAQVYLNGGRIYLLAMVHRPHNENYPCSNPGATYFNNRGFQGANLRTYRLLFNPLRFVASRDMVSIYRTVTQQLPADYQVSNWFGQRVDWGGFQYLYLAHRDDDICTQALFSIFADIKIWVARVTEPVF